MMNLGRAPLVMAMGLALCLGVASRAAAAPLLLGYEINSDGTATLWDIDGATASASNPRRTISGLVGIEFGADGTLFGLVGSTGGDVLDNSLVSIDPVNGRYTLIGYTGLNTVLEGGLALDPTTGTLWGAYDLATPDLNFFTLDTATGQATFVFGLDAANRDFSALAFDASGNLFILNTQDATDSLLIVDKTTGAILNEFALFDSGNPANLGTTAGMDFDPVTGNMYVTDNGTKVLYTISSTGILSFVSTNSLLAGDTTGLTVVPNGVTPVPEPATVLLMATGVAALTRARRRRTRLERP